ncbi:hypothetical protein, partial [Acinetobacter baumannii]|uniref:hypothetical protein n=1 Tax=Acinetobacter baumannii TaxID=470 RepID=UPI0013D25EEE
SSTAGEGRKTGACLGSEGVIGMALDEQRQGRGRARAPCTLELLANGDIAVAGTRGILPIWCDRAGGAGGTIGHG